MQDKNAEKLDEGGERGEVALSCNFDNQQMQQTSNNNELDYANCSGDQAQEVEQLTTTMSFPQTLKGESSTNNQLLTTKNHSNITTKQTIEQQQPKQETCDTNKSVNNNNSISLNKKSVHGKNDERTGASQDWTPVSSAAGRRQRRKSKYLSDFYCITPVKGNRYKVEDYEVCTLQPLESNQIMYCENTYEKKNEIEREEEVEAEVEANNHEVDMCINEEVEDIINSDDDKSDDHHSVVYQFENADDGNENKPNILENNNEDRDSTNSSVSVESEDPLVSKDVVKNNSSMQIEVDDSIEEEKPCIGRDLQLWSSDEVSSYFSSLGYTDEASLLKKHEFDGLSLSLLTRRNVMFDLDLKLGPALKLFDKISKLKQKYTANRNCKV